MTEQALHQPESFTSKSFIIGGDLVKTKPVPTKQQKNIRVIDGENPVRYKTRELLDELEVVEIFEIDGESIRTLDNGKDILIPDE